MASCATSPARQLDAELVERFIAMLERDGPHAAPRTPTSRPSSRSSSGSRKMAQPDAERRSSPARARSDCRATSANVEGAAATEHDAGARDALKTQLHRLRFERTSDCSVPAIASPSPASGPYASRLRVSILRTTAPLSRFAERTAGLRQKCPVCGGLCRIRCSTGARKDSPLSSVRHARPTKRPQTCAAAQVLAAIATKQD